MTDILRAIDNASATANKSVAECPPEMGEMNQGGGSINIQMNDAGQMAQLLQALQTVQQGEAQEEEIEEYENEPEEEYMDVDAVLPSGDDLHKKKTAYPPAAGGDNPMAMEGIKDRLWAALTEKKAKPDFLDVDKDGDKKEPMKKALKDKGSKPKKGKVPPQFQKEEMTAEGRGKVMAGRGRGKVMAGRGRGKKPKLMAGRGRGK